ncbi:uncharacterized protein [Amphiura filiformis]|uniref:uncharacterized protein n=1 Tax=Amphiura filiformis TaxID=82378 RepID=UPI003B21D1C2
MPSRVFMTLATTEECSIVRTYFATAKSSSPLTTARLTMDIRRVVYTLRLCACSRFNAKNVILSIVGLSSICLLITGMLGEVSRGDHEEDRTLSLRHQFEQTNQNITQRKPRLRLVAVPSKGPPKTVVLATANSAYLDFTENWIASMQDCGVWPNVTIIAEDEAAYQTLRNRKYLIDIHVTRADQLSSGENLVFDTPEYKRFVNKRAEYILSYLQSGYNVLFSDVDTYWVSNPFPYFEENYDIFIQLDQGPPKPQVLCAGFVFYRATKMTITFIETWIKRMETSNHTIPDQQMLNRLIRNKSITDLKWKVMEPDTFVSGRDYFNDEWRLQNPHVKPVMLHNNWVIGHDVKVDRFKKLGFWIIDYSFIGNETVKYYPPHLWD